MKIRRMTGLLLCLGILPGTLSSCGKTVDAPETVDGVTSVAMDGELRRAYDAELLQLFIRKIMAHEKDTKWSKRTRQTVEIHYNNIGCVGTTLDETQIMTEPA